MPFRGGDKLSEGGDRHSFEWGELSAWFECTKVTVWEDGQGFEWN
jgi:hypothetical protein